MIEIKNTNGDILLIVNQTDLEDSNLKGANLTGANLAGSYLFPGWIVTSLAKKHHDKK